ncbi:MAG: DNA gyrase C-terminal beta-propeller domain-containing protein, partial [Planctomycetaceae bacterium]
EYLRLLSDESHLLALVRAEMEEIKRKYGDKRRSHISDEEIGEVRRDDLIPEETMAVTLSHRGYIKRMELSAYRSQKRGGRGVAGAKTNDEDPIAQLFVASTHNYLLFFTDRGKVFWQKVYDLPLLNRTAKGRAVVNLLNLQEGEKVFNCLAVREFDDVRQVVMATRNGVVKKTSLSEYSRPKSGGIIAIRLDDGDELIDVVLVSPGQDLLVATSQGMAIRFSQEDARSMGRATYGVKGINLATGDYVVGMVVADPDMDLLTVCENGYGKRTPFGKAEEAGDEVAEESPGASETLPEATEAGDGTGDEAGDDAGEESGRGTPAGYRRQRRGGKGLRNIRCSERNGRVVDVIGVSESDEVLMVTAGGIIQRIRATDISRIGRNTQGVRIIRLDAGDKLVGMARVPAEDVEEAGTDPDATPPALPPA